MNNCKDQFVTQVGLDWADKKHVFCLQASGEKRVEQGSLEQSPEAISDWVASLRQRFGSGQVAIFLEQSKGALINALMCYENLTLFPINPKSLSRFRSALYPSGSKDDPQDAQLALEFGSKHREHLTPWEPDDVPTRHLTLLNQARRKLVGQRTQLSQRLTSTLKAYFPQAFRLLGQDLWSPMATDFLKKWPTLSHIQAARPQTVRSFYYRHNSRSEARLQQRLELLAQAAPLTTDEAIVQAHSLIAQSLAAQLATLRQQIQRFDQQIAQLYKEHPDRFIFDSFPGVGPVFGPRLLCAFGTRRDRFPYYEHIQCLSGIAPITERSGASQWVHIRWACPKFLRQSFHEFARFSRKRSAWASCYYEHQLSKGKKTQTAFRALAYKWQRILWRCWRDRTPYNEAKYVQNLLQRDIPIYRGLASSELPNSQTPSIEQNNHPSSHENPS